MKIIQCPECHRETPFSEVYKRISFHKKLEEWGLVEELIYTCSGNGKECGNKISLGFRPIYTEKILESK
jgi:hypothetical protein